MLKQNFIGLYPLRPNRKIAVMRSPTNWTVDFWCEMLLFCRYKIVHSLINADANTNTGMTGDRKIGELLLLVSQIITTMEKTTGSQEVGEKTTPFRRESHCM
jgi:hypothetical protein